MRCGRLIVATDPLGVGLVLARIGPHSGDDGGERRIAIGKGRRILSDAVAGAVDRVDVHRGVHHRYSWSVLQMCLDGCVGQFRVEVGLPVVLRPGGTNPSNALLSAGYGIGPTISATVGATSRIGRRTEGPSSSGPAQQET